MRPACSGPTDFAPDFEPGLLCALRSPAGDLAWRRLALPSQRTLLSGSCPVLSHHPGNMTPPPATWPLSSPVIYLIIFPGTHSSEIISSVCIFICPISFSPHSKVRTTQKATWPGLSVFVSLVLEGPLVRNRGSVNICRVSEQMCAAQYIDEAPSTAFQLEAYNTSLMKRGIFPFTMQAPFHR